MKSKNYPQLLSAILGGNRVAVVFSSQIELDKFRAYFPVYASRQRASFAKMGLDVDIGRIRIQQNPEPLIPTDVSMTGTKTLTVWMEEKKTFDIIILDEVLEESEQDASDQK